MDYQTRHRMVFSAVIFGVLMVLPTWSFAETISYVANLPPQNNSGVTGTASLTHNSDNDTLHVSMQCHGIGAESDASPTYPRLSEWKLYSSHLGVL